jgi:pimeloyl-ACP methyl ester carboxylesterase
VRALAIPTLVIGTDHDFIHPLSYAQILADLIPAAKFKAITSKVVSTMRRSRNQKV